MTLTQTVVSIYGVFTLVGGIIGFFKAKSKASLIAGSVFGIVLLLCVGPIGAGNVQTPYVVLLISLILGFRFFKTWKTKKKVMPDLMMVILSSITAAIVFWEIMR